MAAFLSGRYHIYECAVGHKWESGDREHHPIRPYTDQLCAHYPCEERCVKMVCPHDCWGEERSRCKETNGRRARVLPKDKAESEPVTYKLKALEAENARMLGLLQSYVSGGNPHEATLEFLLEKFPAPTHNAGGTK